jgi:hypothetical protein
MEKKNARLTEAKPSANVQVYFTTSPDGYPIVQASARRCRDGVWSLRVAHCPLCGNKHNHGGGSGDTPFYGARTADCGGGGYMLVPESEGEA